MPSVSPHPSSVESMPSHCSFCSVRRPELQGPLFCWPEFPSSPLAVATTGAVPGSRPWGWPSTPLSLSPMILPPVVSQVSLFWGVVLGGGGSNIYFIFFGSNSTGSDAGSGLSAPGGKCRGPTGCSPCSLHSNWLPPPGRGSSRHLYEGS